MAKYCMGCREQYEEEFEICPYCGYVDGTRPEQALHMEPGSILHERYIVGRALGFGGFGITYIGWDTLLEHKVAIKEYLPSEFSTRMPGVTQVTIYNGDKNEQFQSGLTRFVDEARKLAKVSNVDGIVKIYDSFRENSTAYIVMEYLEGETLAQRLERDKTIEPEAATAMLLPVIESLQTVHERGIIHRDLAPDNLFVTTDGSVKVIDFGAARFATTSHSRSLTVVIKPGYSPEEQYRSRSAQGGHTDVYAIGATLYRMITGITPPDALERYAMAEGKRKDILEPISRHCKKIDPDTENAILNAMNIRIEDRTPTMAAFLGELQSEEPVKRVYGRIKRIDTLRWPLWTKISAAAAAVAVVSAVSAGSPAQETRGRTVSAASILQRIRLCFIYISSVNHI
jgi:serine/threonine protein kinase